MAHSHSHDDSENYFLDQIFTIALCGALGVIAILLYVRKSMMSIILAPQFHPYVLAGGIILLVLVVIRAIAVWKLAGEARGHAHTHSHAHDHDHAHSHHDHDHGHHHHHHEHGHEHEHHHAGHKAQEAIQEKPAGLATGVPLSLAVTAEKPAASAAHQHADCDHEHEHGHCHHDHEHGHQHGHDHGHDHGWAPWRYTVLMLPVVLYFLNLPNEAFSAKFKDTGVEVNALPAQKTATTLGVLSSPLAPGPLLAAATLPPETVQKIDLPDVAFSRLENAAYSELSRRQLDGKTCSIIGKFVAGAERNKFGVVRYKMNCCAADALPLNAVLMIDPNWQGDPLDVNARQQQWVEVVGRLRFLQVPGKAQFVPAIIVHPDADNPPNKLVRIMNSQPPNPYAN